MQRLLGETKYLVGPGEKLSSLWSDHVTDEKVVLEIKTSAHEDTAVKFASREFNCFRFDLNSPMRKNGDKRTS
jgi:hypothetical protein